MSHFSTELRLLIEKRRLSQKRIHGKTRIPQGTLSRYMNDDSSPDWRAVEKIARVFPDQNDRARLITAHARDVIHPSLAPLIVAAAARRKPKGANKSTDDARQRMPAKLRTAYDKLGVLAIEHEAIADVIRDLASFASKRSRK